MLHVTCRAAPSQPGGEHNLCSCPSPLYTFTPPVFDVAPLSGGLAPLACFASLCPFKFRVRRCLPTMLPVAGRPTPLQRSLTGCGATHPSGWLAATASSHLFGDCLLPFCACNVVGSSPSGAPARTRPSRVRFQDSCFGDRLSEWISCGKGLVRVYTWDAPALL
jgi:hypothetical protein